MYVCVPVHVRAIANTIGFAVEKWCMTVKRWKRHVTLENGIFSFRLTLIVICLSFFKRKPFQCYIRKKGSGKKMHIHVNPSSIDERNTLGYDLFTSVVQFLKLLSRRKQLFSYVFFKRKGPITFQNGLMTRMKRLLHANNVFPIEKQPSVTDLHAQFFMK